MINGQAMRILKPFGKVLVGDTLYVLATIKIISKIDVEYMKIDVDVIYETKKSNFIAKTHEIHNFHHDDIT